MSNGIASDTELTLDLPALTEGMAQNAAEADRDLTPYPILGRVVDLGAKPEPLDYLIEDMPFAGGGKVNAVQGAPNAGKSPFALLLALCVALGLAFLGRRVLKPGPVLYLDGETGLLAHIRFQRLCHALGVDPCTAPVEFRDVEVNFSVEFLAALEAWLRESPKRLVVVDTYGAMLGAEIDNNSPQFALWLRQLGRLSRVLNVVIVVLIHERKGKGKGETLEGIAGNYQGAGAFQGAVSLARTGEGNEAPLCIRCTRSPEQTFKPFEMKWEDTDLSNEERGRTTFLGLRAVVVEPKVVPVSAAALDADHAKRAKVAWQILEAVTRTPGQARTKVLRHIDGLAWGEREKLFGEMVERGLLTKSVTGIRETKSGTEEIVVYMAADPSTQAAAEARLKLGLVAQ
ncbi:MAG: AAA family ATPase [Myxococcales bacterium]